MIRFHIVRWMTFAGLVVLGVSLFRTQVVEGDRYRVISENNRIRRIPLEAPRGRVLDRKGHLLVTNRASYDVVATPEDMTPEGIATLSELLEISQEDLKNRLKKNRQYLFTPSVIAEDVTKEQAFLIEEHKPELPGVSIHISSLRHYPYGNTASHIIGYIGKVNEKEYRDADPQRMGMNSFVGRAGLEKLFDDYLRGWRGGRQLEVNAKGQLIQVLSEKVPEPGGDLQVSLDLDFQNYIMELIKDKHAAIAVMDLDHDELLALASNPAYDPNAFVEPGRSKERLKFLRDKEAPLLDRGVASAYPPGSVFKLVTALAALETGKITPKTRFHCNGSFRLNAKSRPFKCWYANGHGSINLYEAIERSCNVYFYNIGAMLSPDEIANHARKLGFGEKLELDVTNVAPGLVPDRAWKKQRSKEKWYQGDTLSFAIGQSYLLTSPLQVLRLVSIIAKDGDSVEPKIVINDDVETKKPEDLNFRKENLKVLKRGMLKVVESPYGTGQFARVDFDQLAAKTGTAQVPPNDSHSWMAGFFPYDDPKISFVVFVEHGGSGGVTAAKIVKDVLMKWKDLYVTPVA